MHKYGNTGSAAIPVSLDEANRSDAVADGDLVVLAGFGGGMSISASLMRWWRPSPVHASAMPW
ncbi:3-oxoacyl-[acyl-carrier-protein (ACP)] synthase III-like protein [Actinophytocola oryzae]|uniref:3-oxoacyl-[acyl-carrier-protein (ACP)] synthase III-like protein n=1 Tax=Actinophytocola oryzae TaxID=502181 RepID=A0A4R7US51_9PSEU|nr:3-oxoacyl-[acyl-carrier-protein (ACP)] synthase III-like protein [Actinophytocola oryzae]